LQGIIIKLFLLLFTIASILNAASGEKVYLQNCANCHSINMSGGMGPDFNIVSYKRKKEVIKNYILNPTVGYKELGYSANAMPRLPLKEDELEAIAEFIDALQPFKEWMKK